MHAPNLSKSANLLLLFVLVFTALYFGRQVLIPIVIAAIFAMLLTPVSDKLERHMPRTFSVILSVLLLVACLAGIILLLNWQISDLVSDLGKARDEITKAISGMKKRLSDSLGIDPAQQQQLMKQQSGDSGKIVQAILGSVFSVSVNAVLVAVYVFLFLHSRDALKSFIIKLVSAGEKAEANRTIAQIVQMTQSYLTGLAFMILILWVLYGIGFSIIGVKNGLFFAILCGLLEVIPFVGNLTGSGLTVIMVLVQGGGTSMVIGVICTYLVIQFVQTYVLEPLVVGERVNLNPLFTILAIVVWEAVWGPAGMFLAIPLTAILKIIFDHVEHLRPYGQLMGPVSGKQNKG